MSLPERILILDGQTNQALACVRSLGAAGYEVFVASIWNLPLSRWSKFCKGVFRLSAESIEAYALLRDWSQRRYVKLVLPMTERSSILCNVERKKWGAAGITIGCGPDEMLLRVFDKSRCLQLADHCGASVPPTRFPASFKEYRQAAEEIGLPCVIKPRFSHAWDGTTFLVGRGCAYVNSFNDLDEAVLACKQGDLWPIIQAYVEGKGKGVFALCNHGKVVAWFAHERLRDVRPTGSGSSVRRSVAMESRLRMPSERLLRQLQWHGPAMVEFRDDGVNPWLMEVNGRFWGSLQLAIDSGVDFPRLWVSILKGEVIEPQTDCIEGITLRWIWGDVKRFLYILTGPPRGYTGSYPGIWQGVKDLFGSQPPGTRLEIFRARDPLPAVGEWFQGLREIVGEIKTRP